MSADADSGDDADGTGTTGVPVPETTNVAAPLRERRQWMLWDASHDSPRRPGGWDPDRGRIDWDGSWRNPSDFLTFEEAIEAASTDPSYGVGFVFTEMDPWLLIELDGCLRSDMGPKPWLPSLDPFIGVTAIEVSPSGGGLHIPIEDPDDQGLPEWWDHVKFPDREHEGVEAYEAKFVTVTGNPLFAERADDHPGPNEIPENAATTEIGRIDRATLDGWLAEAHEAVTGEDPRETAKDSETKGSVSTTTTGTNSTDVPTLSVYDVRGITRSEFPAGKRQSHPVHGSGTGANFSVDEGGETWRCWSAGHECTGNAYHLIGVDAGIIDCGEWSGSALDAETWREVFDEARDRGHDVPSPDSDPFPDDEIEAILADLGLPEGDETDLDGWGLVRLLFEDEGSPNGRAISEATSLLLGAFPTVTERETGATLVYDDETGVFDGHGEMVLQRHLVERLGDAYRAGRQREIVARVTGHTETPIENIGGPVGRLCVANGVLDLRPLTDGGDLVLQDHSPEYRFRSAARAPFDPGAECPRFERFVNEVVRDEDRDTLQEYAGYTLMHWGQPYKRAALLLGPQDSGKSTFLDVIVAVLGEENVSGENLDSLVNSRWGVAETYRKFANITNELDTNALYSLGRFKTLVGGDSLISAERKGENKFDFRPTAKHMFAANEVPPAKDADDAFHERWLHVSFPRTIPKHQQEKNLDEWIIENELAGVLNWMIDGYARLVQQGGFTRDPYVGDKRERWESYGDSIKRFKHNCLDATGSPDEAVVKEIGYALYTAYCEHIGVVAESQSKLTRDLKTDSKITDGKRRVHPDDKRRTVYVGVSFNEDALDALDFDPGAMLDHMRKGDRDGEGNDASPDSGLGDFRQ